MSVLLSMCIHSPLPYPGLFYSLAYSSHSFPAVCCTVYTDTRVSGCFVSAILGVCICVHGSQVPASWRCFLCLWGQIEEQLSVDDDRELEDILADMWPVLMGTFTYIAKIIMQWMNAQKKYQTMITKYLYDKTHVNGKGLFTYIMDSILQQEIKESVIAYYFIWQQTAQTYACMFAMHACVAMHVRLRICIALYTRKTCIYACIYAMYACIAVHVPLRVCIAQYTCNTCMSGYACMYCNAFTYCYTCMFAMHACLLCMYVLLYMHVWKTHVCVNRHACAIRRVCVLCVAACILLHVRHDCSHHDACGSHQCV